MATGDIRKLIDMIKDQDGEGSGLDADKLEGQEGSFYRNASNLNAGTVPTARLSGTYDIDISGNAATATNADKLDNFHASQTPQPNVIPVTGSDGKLASDFVDSKGLNVQNINANYTTDNSSTSHECLVTDASSSDLTITLSTLADKQVTVKKIDTSSHNIVIQPSSGQIDGQSSITISSQYDSYTFVCDGTNWWII